jgi:hypothetical protein
VALDPVPLLAEHVSLSSEPAISTSKRCGVLGKAPADNEGPNPMAIARPVAEFTGNGPVDAEMHLPIVLFASGWRTGSTLLQRLLCSHRDIHIWGENRGMCEVLHRVYRDILAHRETVARAEQDFRVRGADAWIANLSPRSDRFLCAVKAMLDEYLAYPVIEMGKSQWGFKEVRHGLDTADFLRLIYPDARFLLLTRHPRDCLASARATQRTWKLLDRVGGPSGFLEHWARTANSFLRARDDEGALLVRFEDLTAHPEKAVVRLASFLGTSPDGFRGDVFATRRRGWTDDEPCLTEEDMTALANATVWDVAREYGYDT